MNNKMRQQLRATLDVTICWLTGHASLRFLPNYSFVVDSGTDEN